MTKRLTTDFDAVVIGAGHNGLITAAYLARHGLSTLLIEARDGVGGTAASDSFAGSTVNICNCDHLTIRTTPVMDELNLAAHGLSYINIEPPQINLDWNTGKPWRYGMTLTALLSHWRHLIQILSTVIANSHELLSQ